MSSNVYLFIVQFYWVFLFHTIFWRVFSFLMCVIGKRWHWRCLRFYLIFRNTMHLTKSRENSEMKSALPKVWILKFPTIQIKTQISKNWRNTDRKFVLFIKPKMTRKRKNNGNQKPITSFLAPKKSFSQNETIEEQTEESLN